MRGFMSFRSINLILLPLIVFVATTPGCGPEPTPTPPDKLTKRKVIVTHQLTSTAGPEQQLLWGTWIKHPYPQVIPPGKRRKASVIIDPDSAISKVRPGQKAEFALTGYINGQVIGGVNFTITKDKK
jgi:hypothetical protein